MIDRIRFAFNWDKTLDAMYMIVFRLTRVEKVKLMKLLYLIDREHFLAEGTSITGDILVAMPHGPVPSRCLNAVNGDLMPPEQDFVPDLIHREDNNLMIREGVTRDLTHLCDSEIQVIESVLEAWGSVSCWDVVRATHDLAEYKDVYQTGTSTTIEFEKILKASGSSQHWRHNRPVISEKTAASMAPPSWANEKWDV